VTIEQLEADALAAWSGRAGENRVRRLIELKHAERIWPFKPSAWETILLAIMAAAPEAGRG